MRLCPGSFQPHREEHLRTLAEHMRDSEIMQKAPGRPRRTPAMKSGYAYLGQFIDHDLTLDETPCEKAQPPEVAEIINFRTPRLDLDSLYGKDPSAVSVLYESDGTLRLGRTTPSSDSSRPVSKDDLYRDAAGNACLIERRNDENLVVAQLHVLFAKFHNRLLSLLSRRPELAPDPASEELFAQTRTLTTWIYQWIVVHEFLPSIIRKRALDDVWQGNLRLYPRPLPSGHPMSLPIEFTGAAFRFGHSMVQDIYSLNDYAGVKAEMLLFLTKRGRGIGTEENATPSLPAKYVIDWDFFFSDAEPRVNRGQNIDTFIPEVLYPPFAGPVALPELTLLRGSRMGLPSGEEFARHFGFPVLSRDDIPALDQDRMLFAEPTFRDRTPLWYYLLREAVVERSSEQTITDRTPVQKLGPIGSQIMAEVFYQILAADSESIHNRGRDWRPPELVFGARQNSRPLGSMGAIVEFVRSG